MTEESGAGISRVRRAWLNARVNFIFYFLTLLANFIARKIFLEYLGDDFVGLTGTLLNILGYLNIAELGVSSAIAFNLYKPIKERNRDKINEIISLLGYYYRNIGILVGGVGIIVSAFLYFIFKDSTFQQYGVIYFAFYSFLISSLLGYFFNYRQLLLVADQRNYVVSSLFQSSNIIKAGVQIFVSIYWHNLYAWIAIELIFSLGYCLLLNVRIKKIYPWLRGSCKEGKRISKSYPEILKSTKQVFIHKIKDFLLSQSDQLFVFIFVSLKMVAFYGNYVLVVTKVMQLFNQLLEGVVAGIGNLLAEKNLEKMLKVFWELMAVRYFIAGLVCYTIYYSLDPFICLWVGEEYLLGNSVLILLVINLFIFISRGTVDNFNFAFGHFSDVWAAWVELFINVGVTVVGGYFWGIPGILLGKTLSMIPIIIFWKPFYLFKEGFNISYIKYWKGTVLYYASLAFTILFCNYLLKAIPVDPYVSFMKLCIFIVTLTAVFGVVYFALITLVCPGGRNLVRRILKR